MKEPQLKQINKQNKNLSPIQKQSPTTEKKEPHKEKYETINSLPSWNIEPPLEIKRGN